MSLSALERFLLEPLRQGAHEIPLYQKLFEEKTQDEQEESLGNVLAETLREGKAHDTTLVAKWVLHQFEEEYFGQAVYHAFWQLADVGQFGRIQQLWTGCLYALDQQQERVDFFMNTVLQHMGDTVYHPFFVGIDPHLFLKETSDLLKDPLKGQAHRILAIMQKSILEQECFGKTKNCDDGIERLLNVIDGVTDKTTMLTLAWAVFEKISDARQINKEQRRTKELEAVIAKIFSFPFSWSDVLESQPQGRDMVLNYLVGQGGQTLQEDTISYLAFALNHKLHDTSFIQEGYKHPKAHILLEQVEASGSLDEVFAQDKKTVGAFLEKSLLVQSGVLNNAHNTIARGRKI